MAVIAPVPISPANSQEAGSVSVFQWANIAPGDTCLPISDAAKADRFIEFDGPFGGATMAVTGTTAGISYKALRDMSGIRLDAITAASCYQIMEGARSILPTINGGTGSLITVTITLIR
jgi:hypothetical protein